MGEAALVERVGGHGPGRPPPAEAEPARPVVRVRGFGKRYRGVPAVDGVDLEIRRGEIHGLIGPDGAGKSSLMKAIAGVLTFEAGSVEVFGVALDSEATCERVKSRLGFMPQGLGLNLYADLSVEENVDFFARLHLVPERALAERKAKLLAMTRLDRFRERPMKHLSGGMKQKLGLACTLIHEPELIVLDEPTTGVDAVSRREFWAILAELLQEKGITALVSTAYMDEAARFERASLLYSGRILAAGEPETIRRLVPGRVVALRSGDPVAAMARLKARFTQVEARGPWLNAFVAGADAAGARAAVSDALAGVPVENLNVMDPDLEDVFVALLQNRNAGGEERPAARAAAGGAPRGGIAIEALELTRDFGSFRAVDHASFRVPQGEIFGLLGANGAGKTTVIKMLTGIIRPSGGSGRVAGVEMRAAAREIKERIGYMSQAFSLYGDLTVLENIHLYAGIYGLGARATRARAEWVTGMAGLSGHEGDAAGSLPMGLRQRLALGCALVHRPQVLFLDEPTSGVDPIGRRRFWDILFALSREEGVAVLVTTHYMSEAEHCDHLALMYAGRIVADATPARMKLEVEAEAGCLLEVASGAPHRAVLALRRAGYAGAALFGTRVHVFSRDADGDLARIPPLLHSAGIEAVSVAPRRLSMEDVFVHRVSALETRDPAAPGGRP